MQKNMKKGLIALVVLALLIGLAVFAYLRFGPNAAANAELKNISVTVVHGDGSEKVFELSTNGETLRAALDEAALVSGEDGPYGLYIFTVDGETVDEGKQQWWCLTKGGEQHNQGVDGTIIADGEQYELTFKEGW